MITWDERMKLEDTHSAYDASDNEAKLAQLLVGVSHKIHLDNKWTWRTTTAYNMQHLKNDIYYYGLKRVLPKVLSASHWHTKNLSRNISLVFKR